MRYTSEDWKPTKVIRIGESEATSTGVTQVETDAGWAYCKPMGNRQGPHVLACEWVCVRLAKWFGLQTFDATIIPLDEAVTFPLPSHKGQAYHAAAGPAFLTRSTPGRQWNATSEDLKRLANPRDLTLLVAFDTWILNRDRHHPDANVRAPNHRNVYFASDKSRDYRLIAMDHTHCFNNGVLDRRLCRIEHVKDDKVYGLFPEFVDFIDLTAKAAVIQKLGEVTRDLVREMIDEVPEEWEVDQETRDAWAGLILGRAQYLGERLPDLL